MEEIVSNEKEMHLNISAFARGFEPLSYKD